ncbi:MAG: DUF2798 domain-containing protein [Lachnospiraceae bacterium]|jgi:hypothetical protein|nr:DUF2798 domain-containing protein [Lachnospiraceae bacterium]MCI1397881.1 DUF2798 domain-containing protein [Lachnospiraceae bacterium]MCI1423957.1 DUF2798 domain-containing protein [Lachnospiraceae bacterium]MCI1452795.1 DUF2798 domain-containing protein [Lachnospiraceae bacterium]
MPKTKFQNVVFTAIMAFCMVYGMIVYNISLARGGVSPTSFLAAFHEIPIMMPIAFVLEITIVGKLAARIVFSVLRPTDRPQFVTYAMSLVICAIMCPIMSLIATILFKDSKTFSTFIQTWAMNFPMALLYQMFYCGPFVRLLYRTLFRVRKTAEEQTKTLSRISA